MAALAYLFPPISGCLCYLWSRDRRTRFHGLQSVALGVLTPLALYGASAVSPAATRVVAATAGLLWLIAIVTAAIGRDFRLPLIGRAASRLS